MTLKEIQAAVRAGQTVVIKKYHRKARAWAESEGLYVPVHRPSKWGNPFRIGRDGTRDEVCEKYADWLQGQPDLLADIGELRGRVLGCYCAPDRCHGDELARLANPAEEV